MIVSTAREPADLPSDSPEGVVQRYLRAVAERDVEAVRDTYSQDLRERCEREYGGGQSFPGEAPSFRAELIETREVDDGVEVVVRITEFSGEPPFDDGGYDHRETYVLERDGGTWALSEASWPYYACGY